MKNVNLQNKFYNMAKANATGRPQASCFRLYTIHKPCRNLISAPASMTYLAALCT